jgi:hypothetical protein
VTWQSDYSEFKSASGDSVFTYGLTRLGVKEYAQGECECGDSRDHHEVKGDGKCSAPGCECRAFKKPKLLSFAVDRPEIINHRTVKAIIAERIGWKEKGK